MPCTPPPGGVAAEHRYTLRSAVRCEFQRGAARKTVWPSVAAPVGDAGSIAAINPLGPAPTTIASARLTTEGS